MLRVEQRLEIVEMRVVAPGSFVGERGELRSDGRQPQRLRVLGDAGSFQAHAPTACRSLENSRSYSIMLGSGRS